MNVGYQVVTASDPEDLAKDVQALIDKGWELAGGVAVTGWFEQWENERKGYTERETRTVWDQAMVLRAEPLIHAREASREMLS